MFGANEVCPIVCKSEVDFELCILSLKHRERRYLRKRHNDGSALAPQIMPGHVTLRVLEEEVWLEWWVTRYPTLSGSGSRSKMHHSFVDVCCYQRPHRIEPLATWLTSTYGLFSAIKSLSIRHVRQIRDYHSFLLRSLTLHMVCACCAGGGVFPFWTHGLIMPWCLRESLFENGPGKAYVFQKMLREGNQWYMNFCNDHR